MTNHRNDVKSRTNGFEFGAATPPVDHPLVQTERAASEAEKAVRQAQAQLALIEQKNQLDLQRFLGAIAGAKNLETLLPLAVGDAIANLQVRAQVVLQRDVDVTEDTIEIIITDED